MVLAVVVLVGTVVGWVRSRAVPSAHRSRRRGWWRRPDTWLVAVTSAIYVNQVLFSVYVLRVHKGSARFVARYLPAGWFDVVQHNGPIDWLATRFPDPALERSRFDGQSYPYSYATPDACFLSNSSSYSTGVT